MKSAKAQRLSAPPVDTSSASALLSWLASAGLSTIDQARLVFTAAAGELTVSELAHKCGLPMSTTSRMVWELTELGLVSLNATPGDRRKKTVRAEIRTA